MSQDNKYTRKQEAGENEAEKPYGPLPYNKDTDECETDEPKAEKPPMPLPSDQIMQEAINLGRLREFNRRYGELCAMDMCAVKKGRKTRLNLRLFADELRTQIIDCIKRQGIVIEGDASGVKMEQSYRILRKKLWENNEKYNVMEIQEIVRASVSRIFQLPEGGWTELEKTLENMLKLYSSNK